MAYESMIVDERVARGDVSGRLAGKVVLITGTAGGQGRTTALLFARAGATVVGCDVNGDGLAETAELAAEAGCTIDQDVVDVTDPVAARQWVDAAAARYGGIDVMYNNAGFLRMASVAEMTAEEWHETLRGEMDIVFFPTQAAWPHMIARGGGSIVNISAAAGMIGIEDNGGIAHAAAKGGVIAMTRQYAMEGAPHWIRCNAISPGTIQSPGLDQHSGDSALRRRVLGWPLMDRIGTGTDIAYTGLFLASDESQWITGINIPVDGGMTSKSGFTDHPGL